LRVASATDHPGRSNRGIMAGSTDQGWMSAFFARSAARCLSAWSFSASAAAFC